MPTYRVRDGQQLPHDGTVYDAGADVTLSRGLAYEVRHLVVELDDAGDPVIDPVPAWHAALGSHPDREQAIALRDARQQAADRVAASTLIVDAAGEALRLANDDNAAALATLADIDHAIAAALTAPPVAHVPPSVPVTRLPDDPAREAPAADDHEEAAAGTDVRPSIRQPATSQE